MGIGVPGLPRPHHEIHRPAPDLGSAADRAGSARIEVARAFDRPAIGVPDDRPRERSLLRGHRPVVDPIPLVDLAIGPEPIGPEPIGPEPIGPEPIGPEPTERPGERPTVEGGAAEDDESAQWDAIYAAWRRQHHDYFGFDETMPISQWRESVRRQHGGEIGLLRVDDDLRAAFGPVTVDLSECVALVAVARRRTGFVDFAPAVLGFVLIGLAQDLHEPGRPAELVGALFAAAELVLDQLVETRSAGRVLRLRGNGQRGGGS